MIYPEYTFVVGEPKMEEAATCSLVTARTNIRKVFHLFPVFFSARHASKGEGTRRNVNKGRKKKCSGIKVKHSHLLPFDLRDMDVGTSVASGPSERLAGKKWKDETTTTIIKNKEVSRKKTNTNTMTTG